LAARSSSRSADLTLSRESARAPAFTLARVVGAADAEDTGANRLVHGDNLDAMRWLAEDGFAGRFRCVYLDPPFNTGRAFAEYDDALAPEAWCDAMRPRLSAMRTLLADDGALFAEIDDTMLGALLALLDETMGAQNRVSTITVVRSASTGHKAINAGPVNVADYVLVYAKDRARWSARARATPPQVKARGTYDAAYGTFVANVEAPCETWSYEPLRAAAARALGFASPREARAKLGSEGLRVAVARFAIEHAAHVVRFAQPRVEAVSREAQAWIAQSKLTPQATLRLRRGRHKDMILRGGNRVLFLADKVRTDSAGRAVLVEPLTNVWTDVPFQGIAREGGVVFTRNKKPERLVERVLAMASARGEWVLDPYLGSGTTAAVAHKMGRRWVGIERGAQLESMCAPRLTRVVQGEDETGITKAQGWRGGGGFGVWG
jgi:adenine-specific DNA-methyltransferase